jgi:hypothetical protein
MFKEEFSSLFDAAFDLGLSVWSGHEMATFPALIEFDVVDIDASAGEFAGKRDRVGGDLSLERSAWALLADAGGELGIVALE